MSSKSNQSKTNPNRIRKKIENKKQEIKKLENKLKKNKTGKKRKRIRGRSSPRKLYRKLNSLSPNQTLILEETSVGKNLLTLDIYAKSQKSTEAIGYAEKSCGFPGLFRFLEDELKPAGTHEHGPDAEHRIWEIKDKGKIELVKELITKYIGRPYAEDGWAGVKERIDELERGLEKPLSLKIKALTNKIRRPTGKKSLRHRLSSLRNRQVEYAYENGLSLDESAFILSLEDDEFAEKYEGLKSELRETVETLREISDPYLDL